MKRKLYEKMLRWKREEKGSVALLIDGARRVGKSYIAEEFGRKEYKSYILIDFVLAKEEVKNFFLNYRDDLDALFMHLSLYYKTKLYERESLIIFDEVEEFPAAREMIKYLVKDGRYDYVETGSLISINQNVKSIHIPSEERRIKMFPMDFEEFLWAMGDDIMMSYIKDCYENSRPLDPPLHRRAMDYFRQYLIVGGMPQAVKKYADTKSFEEVERIKKDILNLYRDDIRKYARGSLSKSLLIFDSIPEQLQRHEKRFRFSEVKKGSRFRDFENSLLWLKESMMVNICNSATEPSVGLKLKEEETKFKIYQGDTGILITQTFDERPTELEDLYRKIMLDKLEFNKGMLVENIVAQMLVATGNSLYFYSSYSKANSQDTMEIDFLIRKHSVTNRHNIIPIEVKSNKNYTFTSLEKFMNKFGSYLSQPIILHDGIYKEDKGIRFLPLYMAPLL